MKITVQLLNAFAKSPEGGNPAGVVLEAGALSEAQMQEAARRVGVSETAFVLPSETASVRTRFFTPVAEVPLCGHATVAAFHFLYREGRLGAGAFTQETASGARGVEIQADGTVFMKQRTPEFSETLPEAEAVAALQLSGGDLVEGLPVQIVSTGLRDILVPVRDLKTLFSIKPDLSLVAELCRKYRAVSFHPFTFETKNSSTAHCRDFAPLYGVDEESATGTASGALACYLLHHGCLKGKNTGALVFEQGYSMGRPCEIMARLEKDSSVWVGGTALLSKSVTLEL